MFLKRNAIDSIEFFSQCMNYKYPKKYLKSIYVLILSNGVNLSKYLAKSKIQSIKFKT